jgi:hypothetical protein
MKNIKKFSDQMRQTAFEIRKFAWSEPSKMCTTGLDWVWFLRSLRSLWLNNDAVKD